jgi:hypothetical protein
MPANEPSCPYPHKGLRSKVMVLRVSGHVQNRRIGGFQLSPRVVNGVDIHCPSCHFESWAKVTPAWQLDSWDGPTECSCGEIVRDDAARPGDWRARPPAAPMPGVVSGA